MELLASTAIPHHRRWQCAWWLCLSASTPGGKHQGEDWEICILTSFSCDLQLPTSVVPDELFQLQPFLPITSCSCWFFWTSSGGNGLKDVRARSAGVSPAVPVSHPASVLRAMRSAAKRGIFLTLTTCYSSWLYPKAGVTKGSQKPPMNRKL